MKPQRLFKDSSDFLPTFGDFFDDFLPQNWTKKFNFSNSLPPVNIKETDKEYTLELAAPGLEKKDMDIKIKDGILTIKSEKKSEIKEEKEDYFRTEFNYNSFCRSFSLPDSIDEAKIDAKFENGLLIMHLPKTTIPKAENAHKIMIS